MVDGSLARWSENLDIVVMLEAPDAVLLRRVDDRGHWFLGRSIRVGGQGGASSSATGRRSPRLVDVGAAGGDAPTIVRLRADEKSADALATEVLAMLEARRTGAPPSGEAAR